MFTATKSAAAFAVEAVDIHKRYGSIPALQGVSLTVNSGTICGLLGPNGAGKTTMVRILATLLKPDGGMARVMGYDVVKDAEQVRYHIGLAGQYAAVDEVLTGRDNLEMVGRLYHLSRHAARRQADRMLERFDLTDAAGRSIKTYSGGMRRRLDLAASLIASPPVLFLDEPTTGLDPHSRNEMWATIRELVNNGTTLLLTTQYLEEADRLADQIVVIDTGRVIASGTPTSLKKAIGGERVDVVLHDPDQLPAAQAALCQALGRTPYAESKTPRMSIPVTGGTGSLLEIVRILDAAGIAIDDIALRRPTLDDVFLSLTGHGAASGIDPTHTQ
jgi:ABC-2 type transport system ATP-binding protein